MMAMHSRIAGLAVAAVAVFSTAASAQENVTFSSGRVYGGISAGAVIPESTSFNASTSSGGITTTGSGAFEFKNGYSVSGFGGYKINPYMRGEVELGYTAFDYDKVTGTFTATNGSSSATVSGSAALEGEVQSVIGLARAVAAPLGSGKVTPLLGVGVGFAATDEEITKIGSTAVNATKSHTDMALEGMAGVEMEFGRNFDLGARYRYMWINSGGNGIDNFAAHNFLGTAAYKF
jgi:opacity protein-like surface antigen